ncbi:NAD(P)H-dependent flavin oxidoreductase [Pradoshia sp.]|uniref:NAD(P)H-dependent flavin oxidoreductase n=1 Tax=Pradoshia sp. TaxID=2651281 RepID=UPI003EFF778F
MKTIGELLHIPYPIIQGGMGNISNPILTAAISEAGGLGTIGVGTRTPEEIDQMILEVKERTSKPFALNIPITVTNYAKEMVELAIAHHVPIVTLSAGNPGKLIPILHKEGITVIVVVASVKHARKAEEAGADLLVAEGFEAAGINSSLELTTFTLIPQIVNAVQIPVIAAGGIGDGRGMAAAITLGASGIQMGTRFIATKEAPMHEAYKQKLLDAADTDTLIFGRTVGRVRRILHTPYADKLMQTEQQGLTLEEYAKLTDEDKHVLAAMEGNLEEGFLNSGQVAGLITTIPSVEELLKSMMEEAALQLQKGTNLLKEHSSLS